MASMGLYNVMEELSNMARWPSGLRRVTQANACLHKQVFSSSNDGMGSNPILVTYFLLN